MLNDIKYTLYSQSLEAATVQLMETDSNTPGFYEAAEYLLNKSSEAMKLVEEGRANELSFKIE